MRKSNRAAFSLYTTSLKCESSHLDPTQPQRQPLPLPYPYPSPTPRLAITLPPTYPYP